LRERSSGESQLDHRSGDAVDRQVNPLVTIREAIQGVVHAPERGGNVALAVVDVGLRLIDSGNPVDTSEVIRSRGFEPGSANLSQLALLAQLVEHLHGKEGVDGSSPSEGFTERSAKRLLELSQWETAVTRGHSRALPGVPSSGVSAGGIRLDQAHPNRLDPLCNHAGTSPNRRGRSK
jgi:hypothetical protein